jgi:cysteine desulfurase
MPNINNFVQMMEFDLNDISISIGSACSSGKTDISNVLKGVEMNEDDAKKYIRISTGIFNTDEEIEKFCEVWKSLLSR